MELTYREQLKRPEWQKRRLHLLEAAGWQCSNCGSREDTLHVHHRQYFKGRMAWEYNDDELVVLCDPCHAEEHEELDSLKQILARVNPREAFALLAGFHRGSASGVDQGLIEQGRQADSMAFAAGFVAAIVHGLDIDQMQRVGESAAALHSASSEYRLQFLRRGDIFGEDPA